MGIFANEPGHETPTYLFGPPKRGEVWHGQSGFEAMGHKVPGFRKAAAQEHLKDMGFNKPGDAERRHSIVEVMSDRIERDNSHDAMEQAFKKGLDVTGVYRLLAVLLCEPEPTDA